MRRPSLLPFVVTICMLLARPEPARAAPWLKSQDALYERALEDQDLDPSDALAPRGILTGAPLRRAESWLSIVGFVSRARSGNEVGAMLVVGVALDRFVAGGAAAAARPVYAQGPAPQVEQQARTLLTPGLARSAVQAAWRAVGLAPDDARVESMISRARWAALLPETRLRAMRIADERASADVASDSTRSYDSAGTGLSLEARLTWRLDRLIFADDEPGLERIRMDHHEARMRLAGKVLEALFQWQRAWLDADASPRGSREELDAVVKAVEAEAVLDVLTAGWFASWRATRGSALGR